jgi:cytochrome P450
MPVQTQQVTDPLLSVSKEFLANPYPIFAELRKSDPLHWSEKGGYWIATSYEHVHFILHDLRFGKRLNEWSGNPLLKKIGMKFFPSLEGYTNNMLNENPPEHTRLRSLVNKAFTPKMVAEMRPEIEKIANDLLDKVEKKRHMDFVADYSFVLPITVISRMLGVPEEDRDHFHIWSRDIAGVLDPNVGTGKLIVAMFAAKALRKYVMPLLQKRKANPQNDLISALANAEENGIHLTDGEIVANIILLLAAGHETTVNLISNSLLALFHNPEQFAKLKENPALIETAVDEFLRYDCPVQMSRRLALEDVEVGGKKVRKGDLIVVLIGAANRDPAQFPNADTLDLARAENKHVAFGYGIHRCLGAALAWNEGDIAISTLLKRFPNIKLTVDVDSLEYKTPFSLRGVKSMPVTF